MLTDDELNGIRKPNMSSVKEIKVRIPVSYLVNLHYLKLTRSRQISDIVTEALNGYFEAQAFPERLRNVVPREPKGPAA